MNPQTVGGAPRAEAERLPSGARLGRYTVSRWLRRDPFGDVYDAVDASDSPVTVQVLTAALCQDRAVMSQLASDVRAAAGVSHASVAAVLELGSDDGKVFLVTELVEGHTLRELLDRKRQTGQTGFGAKGATNIILHLCAALAAAHDSLAHGAVSLDAVAVSRSGRIKLAGLGLAALAPLAARQGASPATAPEVIAGGRPSAATDLYGVGALLYELLVGSPPIKGCVRPSEAVEGLSPAIDQLVGRCMAQNPAARPARAAEVRDLLSTALAERVSAEQPAARVSAAQPVARPSAAQPVARPSAAQPVQPAASASLAESLAPGRLSAERAAAAAPRPDGGDERWLVSKGKLDYGPFSLAQVLDQIRASQVLPGHVVIDKDTGSRTKVEDHPLLTELVEATRLRRDEDRRAQAEVVHAKQEKRRGATLYLFIAAAVIGLGGGAYLLYGQLTKSKTDKGGAISGLESGSVETKMSFPSKAERKARRSSRSGSSAKPSGTAGGWDDTVNLDMDEEGGDERLDDSQVNPVLQGAGGALGRCLTSTGTHNANIEFIVKGDGRVSQVRVNGETGSGVANCVRGAMKSLQFPSFNGQRSKHYFDMAF